MKNSINQNQAQNLANKNIQFIHSNKQNNGLFYAEKKEFLVSNRADLDLLEFLQKSNCSPRDMSHSWVQALMRVLPAINILHGYKPERNLDKFIRLVTHLIKHHGEAESIKRLKSYRLILQQYVLDQEITHLSFCKVDKDRFPKIIKWLKPTSRTLKQRRYALSVMRCIELFRCKPDHNTSTITGESTACPKTLHEITNFIHKNRWLKQIVPEYMGYLPMSNRAGPNGPSAISSIADLTALRQEGNEELHDAVFSQLSETIPWIQADGLESLEGNWKHSKLVYLSDRACKTRLIAIADWWSNAALSNIHRTFMRALRKLKNKDLTYFQDSLPKHIKSLGRSLYSSDMTAFTDRFPRILEKEVVRVVHGDTQAQNWDTIIANRSFSALDKDVKYEVGNPMGVLSSWAVSTATHHVVKQFCCYKLAKSGYRYGILGDDSVDTCKKVYTLYHQILEKLGVSISKSKCTVSETGSVEFAKRLFKDGVEVTGLPVYLLQNLDRYPEQFLELIRMCRQRGYSDKHLGPGILVLLDTLSVRTRKILSDILSLPETILGFAPLLEVKADSYASKLHTMSADHQKAYLEQARDVVFWDEVQRMEKTPPMPKTRVRSFEVPANHPLVFAISNRLEPFLGLTDLDEAAILEAGIVDFAEYSIYDAWMRGEYRYLAKCPSLDTYKYYNRGHKATKCKFLVLKKMLELVNSDNTHDFLKPLNRISDMDLYDKLYEALQNSCQS